MVELQRVDQLPQEGFGTNNARDSFGGVGRARLTCSAGNDGNVGSVGYITTGGGVPYAEGLVSRL